MKKSVLIVDDNGFIVNLVKHALKGYKYKTLGASSVKTARLVIEKILPDIIILDRHFPGEDGNELLQELKDNPRTRHIPVMILTGENKVDEVKESLKLGANDYLVKPFKNSVLADKTRRLVQGVVPDPQQYYYIG